MSGEKTQAVWGVRGPPRRCRKDLWAVGRVNTRGRALWLTTVAPHVNNDGKQKPCSLKRACVHSPGGLRAFCVPATTRKAAAVERNKNLFK